MPLVKFTGSGQPSTLINLGLSPTDCGGGGGSYASCAAGTNKGVHNNPDSIGGNDSYIYETTPITITSSFGLMGSLTQFKYSVVKPAWSSGASWNMVVELIPWVGGSNPYGTPFRLDNGTELTNRSDNPTCTAWQWNPYSPKFDPNPGILTGQYVIRITITSNNTNASGLNCVRLDEIFMDWTVLSSAASSPSGLSEPTFSTSTGAGTVNGSGELIADVTLLKSTQSSISCPGNGGSATPLCGLSSVSGRYIVMKRDKTTNDVKIVSSTTISIPYQSATWNYTVTGAKYEDANYTYEHWFEVQEWASSGVDLKSAFLLSSTPSWPPPPTYNYFTATEYVDCQQNSSPEGIILKSYSDLSLYTYIDLGTGTRYLIGQPTTGDSFDHLVEDGSFTSHSSCS